MSTAPIIPKGIEKRILLLRGRKVVLDVDLAELYGVTVKRFREQVRRNMERFPEDFMFTLTERERNEVATNSIHLESLRVSRVLPLAFTEYGALMAAGVLNSPVAIHMSIEIIRAFVRLRELLASNRDLAKKLEALEAKYDGQFHDVFEAIHLLMDAGDEKRDRKMGFVKEE